MKSEAKFIRAAAVLCFLLFAASGCGRQQDDQDPKCAQLPSDQSQSMSVSLKEFPQRLLIDQRFSGAQQDAVADAARTWNGLSVRMIGKPVFAVTVGDVTRMSQTDGCGFPHVPHGTVPVIREDDMEHWKALHLTNVNLAVTRRCTAGTDVQQQGIIFNVNLVHDKQFESIALHEMGHAIGLEHSCAGNGEAPTAGFLSCRGLSADHPYVQAVMFPTLGFVPGSTSLETKEDLRSNDMLRAGCVFRR